MNDRYVLTTIDKVPAEKKRQAILMGDMSTCFVPDDSVPDFDAAIHHLDWLTGVRLSVGQMAEVLGAAEDGIWGGDDWGEPT